MKHRHEYEAVFHPNLAAEMKLLGIKAAEIRKCKTCQREMTFVLTRDGWVQLFEEKESDVRDVLLA
jgi:hypothetical protein